MNYLVYLYLFIGWSWAIHGNGYTLGMIMHSDDRPPYSPLYAFTGRIIEEMFLWPYGVYRMFFTRRK